MGKTQLRQLEPLYGLGLKAFNAQKIVGYREISKINHEKETECY